MTHFKGLYSTLFVTGALVVLCSSHLWAALGVAVTYADGGSR